MSRTVLEDIIPGLTSSINLAKVVFFYSIGSLLEIARKVHCLDEQKGCSVCAHVSFCWQTKCVCFCQCLICVGTVRNAVPIVILECRNAVPTLVHTAMHTHMNRPNSSLDWVLSHWAHFTVIRFIFVLCITVC